MNSTFVEKEVGKTTVSIEVLHQIARLTTLSVQGVSRISSNKGGLGQLFRGDEYKGINVQIQDGKVYVEVFVVMMSDMNVRDISREIQARVSRAISEMVGMDVGGVNIHIMDIDFRI